MTEINQTPIISVEGISKKYYYTNQQKSSQISSQRDSFWALNDISFNLKKGETLGIIGSNGSGKTTLLKILSQAAAPTRGKIIQYGKLIPIIDIGSGFHPDLSGKDNIFLYATVMLGLKRSEVKKNLDEIIDFSELGKFIDEPIKNYSNGMYLRLALSVALFCELDILLLDEIFSVGDSAFMMKSYEKMNQIIGQATTVILASHNMNDILRICSKCLWLEKGQIKMIGHTNDVVSAYIESNEKLPENALHPEFAALHSHREWSSQSAPQTDQYKIMGTSIRNEGKETHHEDIDYNLPILVDIEVEKLYADCETGFSLILTDYYDTTLLITANRFHADDLKLSYGLTGRLKYTCRIPEKLFNQGIYKIHLEVSLGAAHLFRVSNILCFKITSKIPEQITILQKIPIRIVPTFPWMLTQLK